jgi:hypothetical protein
VILGVVDDFNQQHVVLIAWNGMELICCMFGIFENVKISRQIMLHKKFMLKSLHNLIY